MNLKVGDYLLHLLRNHSYICIKIYSLKKDGNWLEEKSLKHWFVWKLYVELCVRPWLPGWTEVSSPFLLTALTLKIGVCSKFVTYFSLLFTINDLQPKRKKKKLCQKHAQKYFLLSPEITDPNLVNDRGSIWNRKQTHSLMAMVHP